jgi:hypothetical protein
LHAQQLEQEDAQLGVGRLAADLGLQQLDGGLRVAVRKACSAAEVSVMGILSVAVDLGTEAQLRALFTRPAAGRR